MQKVSIIMPIYNAEKYIKKTILCILNQTYKNFELILIDDCPIDSTMSIIGEINDERIRIIHNDKNRGIAFSRNVGLVNAKGDYIALMDDDDLAPNDRIEKEVNFLNQNPEIDAIGGRYCFINESDTVYGISSEVLQNPKFIKATLMFMDPLGNGSMMFRKEVAIKHNLKFHDNCLGMEDYLFWIEFSLYGSITNINEILLYWRNIEGNETSKIFKEKERARAEKFFEIQKYAIEVNGFSLSDREFLVWKKMFPEGKWVKKASRRDIIKLYIILKKIVYQAEKMKLSNIEEIRMACRKHFSKRLEISGFW